MKKGRGKPKQFDNPTRIQVMMDETLRKEFTLYCYNNNTTPCELLRQMIEEKMKAS